MRVAHVVVACHRYRVVGLPPERDHRRCVEVERLPRSLLGALQHKHVHQVLLLRHPLDQELVRPHLDDHPLPDHDLGNLDERPSGAARVLQEETGVREEDLRVVTTDALLQDHHLVGGVTADLPALRVEPVEVGLRALDGLEHQLDVPVLGGRLRGLQQPLGLGKRETDSLGLFALLLGLADHGLGKVLGDVAGVFGLGAKELEVAGPGGEAGLLREGELGLVGELERALLWVLDEVLQGGGLGLFVEEGLVGTQVLKP